MGCPLLGKYMRALAHLFGACCKDTAKYLDPIKSDCDTFQDPSSKRDLKITFIFGNQSVDQDSFLGAISWSILANFENMYPKGTKFDHEELELMVETLFDLPKLFSKASPFSHVFIPLINTDDIKILRNKVDILFIIDRLHCDVHYSKTLTPVELRDPRASKDTGLFNLSFNYFMFDHNYPEANMLIAHDDYMSKPGGILKNIDMVIDHHLPISQQWLDTVPFTRVLKSGSAQTLLWEHYYHIWSKDNVSKLANLFLINHGIDKHDIIQEEGEDYDPSLPGDGVSDQESYVKRLMVASAFVIFNDSHSFNKEEKETRWFPLDKDFCNRL
jgi:hypothetical protein